MPEAYYIIKDFLRHRFPSGASVEFDRDGFRCYGSIQKDHFWFGGRSVYLFTISRRDALGRDVNGLIELLETELAIWNVAEAGR